MLASFPGPAQLSVAFSTEKQAGESLVFLLMLVPRLSPGDEANLYSCEWCQDRKDGRKGLIVREDTGPWTAKRAKVTGN